MSKKSLEKSEKTAVKMCVVLASITLLIQKINAVTNLTEGADPLATNCTKCIDIILKKYNKSRRELILRKIDLIRVKLTKDVNHIQVENAFVAVCRVLVSEKVKSTPGTHLDFLRSQLRKNLRDIESSLPLNLEEVSSVEAAVWRNLSKA